MDHAKPDRRPGPRIMVRWCTLLFAVVELAGQPQMGNPMSEGKVSSRRRLDPKFRSFGARPGLPGDGVLFSSCSCKGCDKSNQFRRIAATRPMAVGSHASKLFQKRCFRACKADDRCRLALNNPILSPNQCFLYHRANVDPHPPPPTPVLHPSLACF